MQGVRFQGGDLNYGDEALEQLHQEYAELTARYARLLIESIRYGQTLASERAREFMTHGVGRRLWIIYRCVINIFRLFPPEREKPLADDDRIDVQINHHAFLINVYGVLENLALSAAHELGAIGKRKDGKIPAKQVNLFDDDFRPLLPAPLQAYLNKTEIGQWYREYAKNYRDALSHRIPPYVPPSALNNEEQNAFRALDREIVSARAAGDFAKVEQLQEQQGQVGRANPLFVHSFSEHAKPVYLHEQVLADFATIEQLIEVYIGIENRNPRPDLDQPGT
jgi:hypothetical protein